MPRLEPGAPQATEPRAGADPELERFSRLAAQHLDAPVALVSVVTDAEQLIFGAVGLPPDLDAARRLPLSHALCLRVVTQGDPVVVGDAHAQGAPSDHAAVTELDVVAYAGYPLRDDSEQVIGALCVIDIAPRDWSPEQLAFLADLAAACSSELRLRGERERARRAQRRATDAHRHSRLLLMMAEAFTAATTVQEVTRAVSRVAAIGLGAPMTGVALLDRDGRGLTYTSLDAFDGHGVELLRHAQLTDDRPVAHVARTRGPLYFPDRASMVAAFPGIAVVDAQRVRPITNGARAILPLVSRGRLLGVLSLGWREPQNFQQESREVKSALAGYTAQALERALLLDQRRDVARTLQDAMLTALPQPAHLRLAAYYLPAAQADKVGGDWYDGLLLLGGDLAVMVGDVTGHDMDAAARMGQLRSTLRAFAWDRPGAAPSQWLARLDRADDGLGLETIASALAARVTATPTAARVLWSTAGHPPPVLVRPGQGGRCLDPGSDLLIGVDPQSERHDHSVDLLPGDTFLLYTDGLIERRDVSLDHSLDQLAREAGRLAGREPGRLVRELTATLVDGRPTDDVVVLAVRVLHPLPPDDRALA